MNEDTATFQISPSECAKQRTTSLFVLNTDWNYDETDVPEPDKENSAVLIQSWKTNRQHHGLLI